MQNTDKCQHMWWKSKFMEHGMLHIQFRIHLIVWRTHRPSYDANNNNLSLAACISNFNEHFHEIFSLNCALVSREMSEKKNSHSHRQLVTCDGDSWAAASDVRSPLVRSRFTKLNMQVNDVVAVQLNLYYYYYLLDLAIGPVRAYSNSSLLQDFSHNAKRCWRTLNAFLSLI